MLILEKLLEKKYRIFDKKVSYDRVIFSTVHDPMFITIERLEPNSFLLLLSDSSLKELTYLLGLDRKKISNLLIDWFLKNNNLKKIEDVSSLFEKTPRLRGINKI